MMTDDYLKTMLPNSLSGLIFGFEGINNTVVLLNGPTGCKFYHSATSDNQTLRQMTFDPHNYPPLWYFGQPRVPCTWLDKRDYVYGSEDKLLDAMDFLWSMAPFELLVIVNSPGAALIGDDLKRIADQYLTERDQSGNTKAGGTGSAVSVITVESPGYSQDIYRGFQQACQILIDRFCSQVEPAGDDTQQEGIRPRINLLGLSVFHKYWQGDMQEMQRLASLCGIEVNTCLCCECTVDEIRKIPEADLNVVIDPDYGCPTAEYLKEGFGMPYVCPDGLPVGFEATEAFFRQICGALGCDPEPVIQESERARARSYLYISRVNSLTGLPKGVRYAVHGSPAQCRGYERFLTGYFGMVPDVVSELGRDEDSDGKNTAAKDIWKTDAQLVFADGNIIAGLKARSHQFTGVEIGMPSLGYVDVIPKTHLGINGALLICEQVLNGLMF